MMEKERRPAVVREQAVVSRRGFVGMLLATSAAFATASAPLAAMAAEQARSGGTAKEEVQPVKIARVEDLPPGESRRFSIPPIARSALLINVIGEGLRAYSEECTHLGCAVYWDKGGGRIACPCHEGYFSPTDGAPLAGPPRRPLTAIALEVRDGTIYAVGRKQA